MIISLNVQFPTIFIFVTLIEITLWTSFALLLLLKVDDPTVSRIVRSASRHRNKTHFSWTLSKSLAIQKGNDTESKTQELHSTGTRSWSRKEIKQFAIVLDRSETTIPEKCRQDLKFLTIAVHFFSPFKN
jgi:hypothetical protein